MFEDLLEHITIMWYYLYVLLTKGETMAKVTTFASDDLFSLLSKMQLTKNSKRLHVSYN